MSLRDKRIAYLRTVGFKNPGSMNKYDQGMACRLALTALYLDGLKISAQKKAEELCVVLLVE